MSSPATPPAIPIPKTIGRYVLLDELGSGGMATVYLARLSGEGGFVRHFAIKRVHEHLAKEKRFVAMFFDEARIAAALSHPNIAQVFELGTDNHRPFLAMEYLHGEPLSELLNRSEGALPDGIATLIALKTARALHHAHEAKSQTGTDLGIVHRDVSPQNIFITYDGEVKLTDFGVAKATGRLTNTVTGGLKGKIAYMSPEQANGELCDRRTDIFALGIVLWEMSVGARLFRARNETQTLMRVTSGHVPKPSSRRKTYPSELEGLVMKSLAAAPAGRFQTGADFADGLARLLEGWQLTEGALTSELAGFMGELFADRRTDKDGVLSGERSVVSGDRPTLPTTPAKRSAEGAEKSGVRRGSNAGAIHSLPTAPLAQSTAPPKPTLRRVAALGAALAALTAAVGVAFGFGWLGPSESESLQVRPFSERGPQSEPANREGTDEVPAPAEQPVSDVRLGVTSSPAGATLLVDGNARGVTPQSVELSPGAYDVRLELAGHRTRERRIELEAGRDQDLDFELVPLPPARRRPAKRGPRASPSAASVAPVATGTVNVAASGGWADFEIAGRRYTTPRMGIVLPAGTHTLRYRWQGQAPWRTRSVQVSSEGRTTVRLSEP